MRKGRRAGHEGGEGGGHDTTGMMRWLLTYADLITLLMAFFIVMYAMSSVDVGKYRALASSLRGALAGNAFFELPLQGIQDQPQPLENLGQEMAGALAEMGLEGQAAVFRTERGIVISLYGAVLFDLGKAEIRPEATPVLDQVAAALSRVPNYVSVEGSTDDLPINTSMFPTNWELSVRRASTVVRYFIDRHGLDPRRFLAVGYGEYQPMFPNDSEANRARNRRVDIVVLSHSPFPRSKPEPISPPRETGQP